MGYTASNPLLEMVGKETNGGGFKWGDSWFLLIYILCQVIFQI